MKMLSLVKLPIPCGYQKGEGRGRKTSQGFRKRPMGTCRPFQNGRLLIFRFLKFFTSVCTRGQYKSESNFRNLGLIPKSFLIASWWNLGFGWIKLVNISTKFYKLYFISFIWHNVLYCPTNYIHRWNYDSSVSARLTWLSISSGYLSILLQIQFKMWKESLMM